MITALIPSLRNVPKAFYGVLTAAIFKATIIPLKELWMIVRTPCGFIGALQKGELSQNSHHIALGFQRDDLYGKLYSHRLM